LTKTLKDPFQVGDDRGWLTLSIGLATNALVAGGDLLAAARDALQSAKLAGGSTAVYYDESMEASATSSFRLASDLHHAIEHDELRLHYQPIMDFATNEIAGVEALVRWERPGVGLLAPAAFLDAAERTGQSVPLGNWVVRTACNNALRLGSHSSGPRTMSINVSASQLRDPGLIGTLRDAMRDGECAPSTIVIEVTESVLLHDLQAVAASLEAIRALDVGIDLDDFGTGYSSLQYLRNLPIDRLKVDQGFVAGLGLNGADTAIVASTIALAHALGLRSIAEGVETIEQLALLREMGCDFAQGYLFSRPTDMETFTTWLNAYVPSEVFGQGDATAAALRGADAADRREKRADRRDLKADRRDLQSAARETKANTRDSTATTRDTEANTRDTEANTRDLTATTRDAEANTREYTADGREQTADERDRIADLRDVAASEREHLEDDRERTSGGPGVGSAGDDSHVTRSAASQDRSRARAERLAEAGDRARAGRGRDDATAGRANEASARTQDQAAVSDDGDG
jgi:EAL domain-containing protein (putative c-di-GMP-specific phosphodiesterase class I)